MTDRPREMDAAAGRVYLLGPNRLDLARRVLHGPDGAVLPLAGRAFDVLAYLVEHRYRVISKDELLKAVWPKVVVEENNLAQAITAIRRALGDSREAPRWVTTVAGRGYQFVGDAEPLPPSPSPAPAELSPPLPDAPAGTPAAAAAAAAPAPAANPKALADESTGPERRRFLLGSAAAFVAAVSGIAWWRTRSTPDRDRIDTIAVLPFRPLAGDRRDEAVELGITELLINRLSDLPELAVQPLSSVLAYTSPDRDPLVAGRELGVDAIIEGSVQIRDGRLRLTARLLDVETGRALWADEFVERFDDFFAVQDSLTGQIATALAVVAPGTADDRALRLGTRNPEAWQHYANGRYLQGLRDADALRRARSEYELAERLDPQFTQAIAAQADAWTLAAVFGIEPTGVAMDRAEAHAARALATPHGERVPEAHLALGHVLTQRNLDFQAGRERYRRALSIRPDDAWAHALMALNLIQSQRSAAAQEHIRRAQASEPAAIMYTALGGWVAFHAGQFALAERLLVDVVERSRGAPMPRQFLARVLLARGAGAAALTLIEADNPPSPGAFSNLPRAWVQTGSRDAALAEVRRLEAMGRLGYGVAYDLALIHQELGDRERALAALERAVSDRSMGIGYLRSEPSLASLREEPRFAAVVARINYG